MTTSHTQGRLRIKPAEQTAGWGLCIGTEGWVVARIPGREKTKAEANARRLVAAWNACDGLPTSDLENSALPEIMTNLMEAKVQRDTLLEAAKAALQVFVNQGWDDDLVAAKSLSAAIQKAEGKA